MFVQNLPPEAMPIIARLRANACTPKMVDEIMDPTSGVDVRDQFLSITVPTLVLAPPGDPLVPVELGRWLAETSCPRSSRVRGIPRRLEHQGSALRGGFIPRRRSAAVGHRQDARDRMFTDIVSSTETDVRVGDHRCRESLDQHDKVAMR